MKTSLITIALSAALGIGALLWVAPRASATSAAAPVLGQRALGIQPATFLAPHVGAVVQAPGKGKPGRSATWSEKRSKSSPSRRNSHGLVYDSIRQRVVLFGGIPGAPPFHGDTWEWDGRNWSDVSPASGPPGRSRPGMAYDSGRGRTVLFGGTVSSDPGGEVADTWEWDGTAWTQMNPTTSPPPLASPAMAYDETRDEVVLFGGLQCDASGTCATGTAFADTWTWDGVDWVLQSPTTVPPARSHSVLTYDAARQRIVMFGGRTGIGVPFGDTWEWDGTNWVDATPGIGPSPRTRAAMAYDTARGRTVLFGGGDNDHGYLGDTWEWDGATWTQIDPRKSPAPRGYTSLAYDASKQQIVLFGGFNFPSFDDTWIYEGVDSN